MIDSARATFYVLVLRMLIILVSKKDPHHIVIGRSENFMKHIIEESGINSDLGRS